MRVANGVYVLPIPRNPQEPKSFLNLTLIVDEEMAPRWSMPAYQIRRRRSALPWMRAVSEYGTEGA